MPDTITNELIYEVLKGIQHGQTAIREDVATIKDRLSSHDRRLDLIFTGIGDLHADFSSMAERMDRLENRLGRVETRLNFGEQQQ